jgi:hypothetical protein
MLRSSIFVLSSEKDASSAGVQLARDSLMSSRRMKRFLLVAAERTCRHPFYSDGFPHVFKNPSINFFLFA